jgi:hypothetical protein
MISWAGLEGSPPLRDRSHPAGLSQGEPGQCLAHGQHLADPGWAADNHGGVTTVGSSITVGSLSGRPYSEPDKGCLGDLQGHMTSPRTVRFDFQACDGNVVVIDGIATSDLLQIPGTYTHPDGPPQPMVLTRQ